MDNTKFIRYLATVFISIMVFACTLVSPTSINPSSTNSMQQSTNGQISPLPPSTTTEPLQLPFLLGQITPWERNIITIDSAQASIFKYRGFFMGTGIINKNYISYDDSLIRYYSMFNTMGHYYIQENQIYLTNENYHPTCINLLDGKDIWISENEGIVFGVSANIVYVYRQDDRLYALDKSTGVEKWKIILAALNLPPAGGVVTTYEDYAILPVQNRNGTLGFIVIRENNGEVVWRSEESFIISWKGMIMSESFSSSSNSFNGFIVRSINDGVEKWRSSSAVEIYIELITGDGRVFISLVSDHIKRFEVRDFTTGQNYWNNNDLVGIQSENTQIQSVAINRKYVLFSLKNWSNNNTSVMVYDIENGNLYAQYNFNKKINVYLSDNNYLVVAFPELGTAQGINLTSKEIVWENDDIKLEDPLIGSKDGVLIFSNNYDQFYSFDSSAGKKTWDSNSQCTGTELAENKLYCLSNSGTLEIIDAHTGTNEATLNIGVDSGYVHSLYLGKGNYFLVESSGAPYSKYGYGFYSILALKQIK